MKNKLFWSLLAILTLTRWNVSFAQRSEPIVQSPPHVRPAQQFHYGWGYTPLTPGAVGGEQDPVVAELRSLGAQLVAKGARGTWSPDGKRLAAGKMPFAKGVYLIQVVGPDADASAPRIPFAVGQPFGAVTEFLSDGKDPAWSPDGKWIAFTREVGTS